jgi:hypothetical protein
MIDKSSAARSCWPLTWAALFLAASGEFAQSETTLPWKARPQTDGQLSPQAAYDLAIPPIDIVHRNTDNCSDAELASLQVAVEQAQAGYFERSDQLPSGANLVGLAKQ